MEWRYSLEEITETARRFWKQWEDRKVFAFHGPMGAGKTTLIQALCRSIGAKGSLSSPTFSLINEYSYPGGILYHIDLYRLQDEEEAMRAGVEDCLFSGNISLVEWPERATALFPEDTVHVYIRVMDEKNRQLSF